jgi:hypothetical protein
MDLMGPVLFEMCRVEDDLGILDGATNVDVYQWIVHAAGLRWSTDDFSARAAPEFESIAQRILARLAGAPFSGGRLPSPQARYTDDPVVREIAIADPPPGPPMGEKPTWALWTGSFLPDGTCAWERCEYPRPGSGERLRYSLSFDESEVTAYTIDSLSDFRELVSTYFDPQDEGRVRVRWAAVAKDFDAVHLTARGLATAQDVEVRTPAGIGKLWGWDTESTAWLRLPRSGFTVEPPPR